MAALASDPWKFPDAAGFDRVPADWGMAAWEMEAVRGTIVDEMCRCVSKTGTVAWDAGSLAKIAAVLSTEQVVRLFRAIRDQSPHRESDFRPEFEAAFARHADSLPPLLTRAQIIEQLQIDEATARELFGDDEE